MVGQMSERNKTCRECGQVKLLSEFWRNSRRADGRDSRCKTCANARNRTRYDATHERQRCRRHTRRDIEEFHRRYLAGESLTSLTEEAGYREAGLSAAFRRFGLQSAREIRIQRAKGLIPMWDKGAALVDLAAQAGVSAQTMAQLLRSSGREPQRVGPDHPSWKGGRSVDSNGYVHVYIPPEDPLASMRGTGGKVTEHRLVMARHLGRPLLDGEQIHHINGKRADNRIENLELRIGNHGTGSGWICAECGSRRLEAVPLGGTVT